MVRWTAVSVIRMEPLPQLVAIIDRVIVLGPATGRITLQQTGTFRVRSRERMMGRRVTPGR